MSSCPDGEASIQSNSIKIVLSVQVGVSIIAIFTNIIFLLKEYRHVYFHKNIKVIILFGIGTNIMHSVMSIALQGTHTVMYTIAKNGCDVLVPILFCVPMRGLLTVFGVNNIPLGVAVVTERLIATLKLGVYEEKHSHLGWILGTLATCFAIFMVFASQWNTPLIGTSTYCSAVNKFTAESITMWSYIQVTIEIVSVLAFLFIWFLNLRAQQRKVYNVRVAYQVHENLAAFKLMFPWMFFHLLFFATFNILNAVIPHFSSLNEDPMTLRVAYAAAYIIPFYCLFSPCLLSWIVWQQKKKRTKELHKLSLSLPDGQAYSNYLKNQW